MLVNINRNSDKINFIFKCIRDIHNESFFLFLLLRSWPYCWCVPSIVITENRYCLWWIFLSICFRRDITPLCMKGKKNSLGRRIGSDSVPAENRGADDAICPSLVTTTCKCARRYKPIHL